VRGSNPQVPVRRWIVLCQGTTTISLVALKIDPEQIIRRGSMIQTDPEDIERIRERIRKCPTWSYASTVAPPPAWPIPGRTASRIQHFKYSWTRRERNGEGGIRSCKPLPKNFGITSGHLRERESR
jgi:hypothetical protein